MWRKGATHPRRVLRFSDLNRCARPECHHVPDLVGSESRSGLLNRKQWGSLRHLIHALLSAGVGLRNPYRYRTVVNTGPCWLIRFPVRSSRSSGQRPTRLIWESPALCAFGAAAK
jgi:hypothetical protein